MRGLEDFRFGINSTDKSRGGYHQEIRLSIVAPLHGKSIARPISDEVVARDILDKI